jgi:cobalt-zinc-cadmium efflux system outer membrane protein
MMNTILLLMLQATLGASPVSETGTSFEQLTQIAIAQNKTLQAAREQLRQAEARLTQAGLRPNPSLDFSRSTDTLLGGEGDSGFAVTFSQPIEIGGKRTKRIRRAEAELEVTKAEIADAERRLTGQLKEAYLQAIDVSARLSFLDRTRQLNRQTVEVMNVRLAAGDASRLDSHLLQAENNRVEAQRLQAESRLIAAMLEIRRLAGIAPDASLSLRPLAPAAPAVRDEVGLVEIALSSRPDLQAARLREALAEAGVDLARSQAVPNLTGSVRYAREPVVSRLASATQRRAFDRENVLDFGISIPLPLWNREQGNIREASSKVIQAKAERDALENSIRAEVATASRRYQSASRTLDLIRTGVVNETQAGFTITQLAYRLGDMRLLDVLVQQRSLVDAQIAELTAEAEAAAAEAELELAVGGRLN